MDSKIAIASATLIVSIIFVLLFVVILYRFLRRIWTKLPVASLNVSGPELDKMLGLIIALILVPSVGQYVWYVIQSAFNYFARQIRAFSDPNLTGVTLCLDSPADCQEIPRRLGSIVGSVSSGLLEALQLSDFPVWSFAVFIVMAVIASNLLPVLREGISKNKLSGWLTQIADWFPELLVQRSLFVILVVISFYLGLSALLAIPLFQDKSRPQNLTVETLDKAIEPNILKPEIFEQAYPATLPPIRDVPLPTEIPSAEPDSSTTSTARRTLLLEIVTSQMAANIKINISLANDLQSAWSEMRQVALNDQVDIRAQATRAFSSGLESGIGKKQTAEHYYDLVLWHQETMRRIKESLRECRSKTSAFSIAAAEMVEQERDDAVRRLSRDRSLPARRDEFGERFRQVTDVYNNALRACRSTTLGDRDSPPRRSSFADSLGPIGSWSGWLLRTELMPVVIIVGLVGFSLLGATVSRAVRVTSERERRTLTLDDFVLVIAGGCTAAIVVFLAAYGGLTVLGGSGGDPNPYVLFATCLVGAVFSEDVWSWARRRLGPSSGARRARSPRGRR